MSAGIPEHIDVRRLARQGARFEGRITVAAMPRLAAMVCATDAGIDVVLEIGRDAAGNDLVEGSARGVLTMECQRCLEPAPIEVATQFRLQCVPDADTQCADPAYEPLVVDEDGVAASAIVEDEMILALPVIATHADIAQCGALARIGAAAEEQAEDEAKENPFAVLRKLKQDR